MFKLIVIASFFVFGMTNGAIWRTAGPSVDESMLNQFPYTVGKRPESNYLPFSSLRIPRHVLCLRIQDVHP